MDDCAPHKLHMDDCAPHKLHMDDCAPHKCQQHVSMQTESIYEKSASTLETSNSANVSGTQLLMVATNQESSADSVAAMSWPKSVHQVSLTPILWPFLLSFQSKHGKLSQLPNF